MTARAPRVRHPLFARLFDRIGPAMEREMLALRQERLAGLHGRVLEVGAGNGMSFAHQPGASARSWRSSPNRTYRSLHFKP